VALERCGMRLYTPAARLGCAWRGAEGCTASASGWRERTGSGSATRAALDFRARVEVGRAGERRARGSISPGKRLRIVSLN
jgi:hypothetical protein